MKCALPIRILTLGVILSASLAFAQEGTYRSSLPLRYQGDRGEIRYTLHLKRGGEAQLVSELVGIRQPSQSFADRNAMILNDFSRSNRIVQRGTWSGDDFVSIRMDEWSNGRWEDKSYRFTGRVSRNRITFTSYDRPYYGQDFEFVRSGGGSGGWPGGTGGNFGGAGGSGSFPGAGGIVTPGGGGTVPGWNWNNNNNWDNVDLAGTYRYSVRWNEDNRRNGLTYALKLDRNGTAELRTWMDPDVESTVSNTIHYGEIVRMLHRQRNIRHIGTWRNTGNGNFTMTLTRFDGNWGDRTSSRFTGRMSRDGITISNWDREIYGDRVRFLFR